MAKRTTIEIDEELLARAKKALGRETTRATVDEALRRAVEGADAEHDDRSARQTQYLERLDSRIDPSVLLSEQMWR
ncbi:MAG TPA: type II toxin-antitoxin system VapB family antitoxin [Acidimicrobiales bacterium]|nr:type II toxin-antitoxin system VapB family antitoxin [Acidimicrobiales bacterium]